MSIDFAILWAANQEVLMLDPYAEFEKATLTNGLDIYAAHWPGRPWEAVGFLIHSGAEQDPVGLEGVGHFTEHMVAANTETDLQKVKNFFEENGGQANFGSTGFYGITYSFWLPIDESIFAQGLAFFGEMLLTAK